MLPHPAAANAADVVLFCPSQSAAGVICNKTSWARNSITASAVVMEEVLIAGMQLWGDALRTSSKRIVESRYSLNKRYLLSPVLSMDRLNTLGWILSLILTVQSRIWMCPLLLLSLAIRPWSLLPAQNQDLWPTERTSLTDIHTSTSFLSSSRPQVGLATCQKRTFISYLLRVADNPPLAIRDTWSAIQSVLHFAISKQQLTAAVT